MAPTKVRQIQAMTAIVVGSWFVKPEILDYFFNKENLDLFVYSFISSCGILASTATVFALTVGNPRDFLVSYLNRKNNEEDSVLEVMFDSPDSEPLEYDFSPGMYFLKFSYNDHHSSLYLLNVTGNNHSLPLVAKTKLLSGKDDLVIEMNENKLVVVPVEFIYGTLRITKL